ncbi:MAG: CRISPR system precrRNA processing endoribonuclease RAMP protein Cas6 [bacterium]
MTDLASIVFTLTASAETKLPPMPSRILHGAFLRWLERDHPELVKLLHDNNERRPYTLSDLHGKFEEKNGWRKLLQGETYWYRLTVLDAGFIQSLLVSMRAQQRGPQPDDPKLVPGPAFFAPEQHPYAQLSSFAQIIETVLQQRELSHTVTLRFESPTCFIENKQALPLPVPRYVFGYLANKWQLASPVALPVEDMQHFVESIHLSYARIETRLVDLQKYKRTGFVGECRFALHPALPENYRQALHLLGEIAFFSGVGSHTTMGMGQARSQKR